MDVQDVPLTPEYRFVLDAKAEQAIESGDAALLTAGLLTAGLVVGMRLLHCSAVAIVLLAAPMMISGVAGYVWCRRRARLFERDLASGTVVTGRARAKLTRFDGKAEGSFALTLPDRALHAYSAGAGLRSLLIRPEPGMFSGTFMFARHSGQLLRLGDTSGRRMFDAAATELNETFDLSELSSV